MGLRMTTRSPAAGTLAVLVGAAVVLGIVAVRRLRHGQAGAPVCDYGDRSGFPRPAAEMRGAARRSSSQPPGRDAAPTAPQAPGAIH
ncbi:MAG: hypothetical protein AB1430_21055 [Pseudomonadota bacterium]